MDGLEESDNWSLPNEWAQLFVRHFVFAGWNWQRLGGRPENARYSWRVEATGVASEIRLTLNPSQHEQLEARLLLRDWLRDKVPDERSAELLE